MKIHFYISIQKAENIKIDYFKKISFIPTTFLNVFSKTNPKILILNILKYKQVKIFFFHWSAHTKKNRIIFILFKKLYQ